MHRLPILIMGVFIFIMPLTAGAAGMDIGMSTWYCWWEPSWNNRDIKLTIDPAFFYGPGLSFRLPANVTISTAFLYSRIKAETRGSENLFGKYSRIIDRYDSDSTIGYSFNRFFRLYAGFKYSHYSYNYNDFVALIVVKGRMTYNEYAPALGIGFTINLIDHLLLVINASAIYMASYVDDKKRMYSTMLEFNLTSTLPLTSGLVHKLGANLQLALGYFIEMINITLTIGFRYQLYGIVQKGSIVGQVPGYLDHFYGVTASVIYRIDFEKKKDRENAGEE